MNLFFVLFLGFILISCSYSGFDKDERQIIVRNEIRKQMPPGSSFDLTWFREDTLDYSYDSVYQHPIRYMVEANFRHFNGHEGKYRVWTLFTQDGKSILGTEIQDSNSTH
jgi:hypothetical protein